MNRIDTHGAAWVKSSYSGGNEGECVEFAPNLTDNGIVPVRDSKNPDHPALIFETTAWSTFTASLRA
ncbi:DUF397 domain-containing protein [Streptomyces hesseae]|uniref:DUF397 domain-containing protein n=1 Tax=Streptomyces hesseae TaxID=3075519 RepID=A0ABU2SRF5_9ACTN|nr:DUF397 domain-containing protein [Streptomyces sp. DSM 40473]MDT0451231.1 DUF397 domain-containing protein [Streptomyces sp. DSM 40473]